VLPRSVVTSAQARAVGPYSHGVVAGDLLFLSGQTPLDPATGELVGGGIAAQTRQCLTNLETVLEAAGLGLDDVVKCNVYLVDMACFGEMNAAYSEQFDEPYPARTTVAVAGLPLGADVEIELVAKFPDGPRHPSSTTSGPGDGA
jgi:2-iminobutanoate/2-iminopropanoate deaminase